MGVRGTRGVGEVRASLFLFIRKLNYSWFSLLFEMCFSLYVYSLRKCLPCFNQWDGEEVYTEMEDPVKGPFWRGSLRANLGIKMFPLRSLSVARCFKLPPCWICKGDLSRRNMHFVFEWFLWGNLWRPKHIVTEKGYSMAMDWYKKPISCFRFSKRIIGEGVESVEHILSVFTNYMQKLNILESLYKC